ncbi:MAG: hypothetical protein OXI33_01145 [Chloroflexota bacterium]|nr:hypothetical protein [Chloroflexota bacterium]
MTNYLFDIIGKFEDAEKAGAWVEKHTMFPDIAALIWSILLLISFAVMVWGVWDHFKKDLPPTNEAQPTLKPLPMKTKTPPFHWFKRPLRRKRRQKKQKNRHG